MPPAPMVRVTAVPGTWLLAWLPSPVPKVIPFQKLMLLLFCITGGRLGGDIRRGNRLGAAGQVERVDRRISRNQRRAGVGRRVVLNIVVLLGSAGHAARDGPVGIRGQLGVAAIGDDVIRAVERRPIEVVSRRGAGDGPTAEDAVGGWCIGRFTFAPEPTAKFTVPPTLRLRLGIGLPPERRGSGWIPCHSPTRPTHPNSQSECRSSESSACRYCR